MPWEMANGCLASTASDLRSSASGARAGPEYAGLRTASAWVAYSSSPEPQVPPLPSNAPNGIAPLGARPLAAGRARWQRRGTEGGPSRRASGTFRGGSGRRPRGGGPCRLIIWFPRASEDASTHSFHSLRPVNERGAGGGGRARGGRVVSSPARPAGRAVAQVLRFPRAGGLCGWRPGHPGPGRRGGHRGVCRHADLRAPALKGPERSCLWYITSQGLRYQRLVSGSPGGRPCCRCPLYKRPGGGRTPGRAGEGRQAAPRQPLAQFRSFSSAARTAGLGRRPRSWGLGVVEKAAGWGRGIGQSLQYVIYGLHLMERGGRGRL